MLTARPTTLAGMFDVLDKLPGGSDWMVEVNFGNRYPTSVVRLRRVGELLGYSITDDNVAVLAEPAASTG